MDTQDVLTPPVPHLGLTSACMSLNYMYVNVQQHGIQSDSLSQTLTCITQMIMWCMYTCTWRSKN